MSKRGINCPLFAFAAQRNQIVDCEIAVMRTSKDRLTRRSVFEEVSDTFASNFETGISCSELGRIAGALHIIPPWRFA